jgi:diamine N-acetyltransferase
VSEGPDVIVAGERVALGPLRLDLAALQARWVNSDGVRHGLMHRAISTEETERKWLQDTINAGATEREPTAAGFTIYDRSDMAPVGNATLFSISHLNGNSKFGIMLGERRGQGLGSEATWLVTGWAFHTLGLHNVMLELADWNVAALRAYERAGFRRIGVRRGAIVTRGVRCDEILMDAIPADRPASL